MEPIRTSVLERRPVRILLPTLLALLILLGTGAGFMVYKMTHPETALEALTPTNFLLAYSELRWKAPSGREISGWWMPGIRGAPAVILCHGYGSNRSEVLGVASTLRENGYNTLAFDFPAHGFVKGSSSLGLYERHEVLSAIQYVRSRMNVHPERMGLWGVSMGAYAALWAAAHSDIVTAVAVDSAYRSVRDMVRIQTAELLHFDTQIVSFFTHLGFSLYFAIPPWEDTAIPLQPLEGKTVLYIVGMGSPRLGTLTRSMYASAPPIKDILIFSHSANTSMYGTEKFAYEDQMLNFFKRSLPLVEQ